MRQIRYGTKKMIAMAIRKISVVVIRVATALVNCVRRARLARTPYAADAADAADVNAGSSQRAADRPKKRQRPTGA
jgi:hypothetical protein